MRKSLLLFAIALGGLTACNQKSEKMIQYPTTARVDTVDVYHGVEVADPYRWLEDDNSDSTKSWVTRQNNVTNNYLAQIPFRQKIKGPIDKNLGLSQIWPAL